MTNKRRKSPSQIIATFKTWRSYMCILFIQEKKMLKLQIYLSTRKKAEMLLSSVFALLPFIYVVTVMQNKPIYRKCIQFIKTRKWNYYFVLLASVFYLHNGRDISHSCVCLWVIDFNLIKDIVYGPSFLQLFLFKL